MNDTNPTPHVDPEEAPAPLDAFERQWVDQLTRREPDLAQTEDAFVHAVMNKSKAASSAGSPPAVLARIGHAALPYAVAAAVLLVGFVGWVALKDQVTDNQPFVEEQNNPPQPGDGATVTTNNQPTVELGKLIASVTTTATNPANTLTQTVNEAPEALSVDRLFDLLDGQVPDLKELLAPLESKNEQSRA